MFKTRYPNFWNQKSLLSNLLLPFSVIYFLITFVRNKITKPISFSCKVICIGNLTVGGAGKTQVVKWLGTEMLKQKKKVLIICKGYKGKFKTATFVTNKHDVTTVGDEAKYLSKTLDVIVAKNPKDAADLVRNTNPDLVILDDFLQNPHVTKDCKIVIIDADRMLGNERLIPAGPLRQKAPNAIKDATTVIYVGSNSEPGILDDKSFGAQIICNNNFDLSKKYLAFAGIGNPERFFNCLKLHGLNIIKTTSFPDHHNYSLTDEENLQSFANSLNALLITTPKDAIKLTKLTNIAIFEPELKFFNQGDIKILKLIDEKIKENKILN
jgi:tetraacyldisaccharide 4'-kinase